ncbi:MAG: hypothetical protein M9949_04910 [Candidatus Kapabacteria bacterium]|nr:hypothetical protein [Candidatus Kapabacteria bacterium]
MAQATKVNELLSSVTSKHQESNQGLIRSIAYGSVCGNRLTKSDLDYMLAKMSVNYQLDFYENKSIQRMKCEEIFARCMELNWSSEEFRNRVESFLDTCKWDTFTRADFLNYDRPMLLTHHDVMEIHRNKDPKIWDKIKRYEVNGVILYGEIRHDFQLPEYESINKALPASTVTTVERSEEWNLMGQYLDLKCKYAELQEKYKELELRIKKGSI